MWMVVCAAVLLHMHVLCELEYIYIYMDIGVSASICVRMQVFRDYVGHSFLASLVQDFLCT